MKPGVCLSEHEDRGDLTEREGYNDVEEDMVMAKLHVICGNCGCNDDFEFRVVEDILDEATEKERAVKGVRIICNNCATIHDLSDNAKSHEAVAEERRIREQKNAIKLRNLEIVGFTGARCLRRKDVCCGVCRVMIGTSKKSRRN